MDSNWTKNVYNSIKDISDIKWQKKVWLGLDNTFSSSFDEVIMVLFDDFSFGDFISEIKGLNNEFFQFVSVLADFETKLSAFYDEAKSNNLSDEEVLADKKWRNLTLNARRIIDLWPFELN